MNISLKNMLTSFAAGVLLFSLIMLVVCIVFFNSTVEVKEKAVTVEAEKITEIKLSECIVFEFEETDENNLFCVLVMVDDSNKKLFFTPLYSDYLVPYKCSFSQISTLTEKDVNPATITDWGCKNGYCTATGTVGGIIEKYPQKHGLSVEHVTKNDSNKIKEALKSQKSLVIASVGKGTFTSTSHYIVLRGISDDGKVLVADPNSIEKSREFWNFDLILNELKEPYFYIISK